ncbi:MAG TPA: ribonuclease P protein component [Firmicutes bacterium]|jgi:ribonuclease P protein component|nr:ribonuclease P protein component [Bacillota bacterium]
MSKINKRGKSPKVGRLKKNFQFQRIYRLGKSLSTKNMILFFKKNGGHDNNLGISISKKIGNSVQRHRLKRIYKEAFMNFKDVVKEGFDFIIVARRGAGHILYADAVNDLNKILSRGKLVR